MKCGIKIALAVVLIRLLGADLGLQTAHVFGSQPSIIDQPKMPVDDGIKWTDRTQALSAIAVALFTAALIAASAAQWWAMKK